MPHDQHSVPTALVVDDSFASRARVLTLLHLGGWRAYQAVGTEEALRLAAVIRPDLVVTEMVMRNGHGATLMRRLRQEGSSARFLVVAARRTQQCRALASSAGALACLAKPVDPRLFVDVLRGLAPAATSPPLRTDLETAPLDGESFLGALPYLLSTIVVSAQTGDAPRVALAAEKLALASDRLGHAEVAFLSNSIARDARHATVSHGRLVALVQLCARIDAGGTPADRTPQAATRR